jgi:hypothetical protein
MSGRLRIERLVLCFRGRGKELSPKTVPLHNDTNISKTQTEPPVEGQGASPSCLGPFA